MAYNETTEWEDAQVKAGNFIPTKVKTDYYKEEIKNIENTISGGQIMNNDMNKNNDDDDKSDIDWDDDDFISLYSKNRIKEIEIDNEKKIKEKNSYLIYYDTTNLLRSKRELETTILSTPADSTDINKTNSNSKFLNKLVILFLYKNETPYLNKCLSFYSTIYSVCNRLNEEIDTKISNIIKTNTNKSILNSNIKEDKILIYKMIATDCVSNYENNDIPGVLFYLNNKIVDKIIPVSEDDCVLYENESQTKIEIKIRKIVSLIEHYFLKNLNINNNIKEKEIKLKNDREYYWK